MKNLSSLNILLMINLIKIQNNFFELKNNYNNEQVILFFDFINKYKQNNDINKDVFDCILKVKQNFINI